METSDIGLTATAGKTTESSRYSRVAIILHWAIAGLIIFNLAIGFVMEGFPPPVRFIAVVLHVSSGMTVLVLTVARLVWWMTHEPPPHLPSLKFWEHRLARAVHVALYVAMVAMPLTGWAIISANPPPGSAGAAEQARQLSLKTHSAPAGAPQPAPGVPAEPGASVPAGGPQGGPPPGPPPRRELKVWGFITLPPIKAFREIGETAGGYEAQHALHEEFVSWHSIGGYLLLLALALHVAGAMKHQYVDKEPEFQRMGLGRRNEPV